MKSLMQELVGEQWAQLSPVLQAHHRAGDIREEGWLDIAFPRGMRPILWLLGRCGMLLARSESHVHTVVTRRVAGDRVLWQRRCTYADGTCRHFDSVWEAEAPGVLRESLNAWLGVRMGVQVADGRLIYHGLALVLKIGGFQWCLPEWLGPGHTWIVEEAQGASVRMDFRLMHPLFGEVYRYAGEFLPARA